MELLSLAEKMLDDVFAMIPRRRPELEAIREARIIAHRGAHNNADIFENTLEAFRLAKKAGCWGIEFDVHATTDQVLVVNHDPNLRRLWNKDVEIAHLNFNELRALAPQIPALAEVIAEFGGQMHLFIEIKALLADEHTLVTNLQNLSPAKQYHLLTLDPAYFDPLTRFPSSCLLLVAVHNNVKKFCDLSIQRKFGGVMGNYLLLTNQRIHQLQDAHQAFGVGFVNSKNSLYRELNRGVQWIFTNQAAEVRHYLHQLCLQ